MGARVLVVDDDPWILRMVTATLEKRSYVVDTAREGKQALERAQANPPDVIISDVMMPVMDGWTFVQQLRQDPRLSQIPVIFLTALGKDEARLGELGLGPEDFLAKPFRFDDLDKRVSSALRRKNNAGTASGVPGTGSGVPGTGSGVPGTGPGVPGSYPGVPGTGSGVPGSSPGVPPHPTPGRLPTPAGAYYTPPPAAPSADGPPPGQPYPGYPPGAYPQGAYPYPYPPGYPPGYPYPPPQGFPPGYPPPPPGEGAPPPAAEQQPGEPLSRPPSTGELKQHGSGSFPAQRRTTALNGRLEQLGLSSLLVMMEMERKDGVLTLKPTDGDDIGRIFIRGGQVICAKLDGQPETPGRDCVYQMLRWKQGTFSFNAMEVDMEDTVQSSTTHLLMEGARLIDEANREGQSS